jgi:hypothetical protein
VCLADFGGKGTNDVCVLFRISATQQRVVILDAMGQERAGREVTAVSSGVLIRADLDGDGADELLFRDSERLCAVGRDLKDRWCWQTRDPVREVIPARAGQPAVVVLDSMVGLDGATGRPRWDGHGATVVLDPGDPAQRPPRVLAESGDATVCRLARATTAQEQFKVSGGEPVVQHRSAIDDRRWMRLLPWNVDGAGWLRAIFLLGSVAFVNVVVPVVILKLATRRGVWSIRLFMALPVVVAIPLAVRKALFQSVPLVEMIASSMPGLAVLEYAAAVGQSIFSRRWRRLAVRVGLTALVTVVMGTWWLWYDMRGMAAIEHYNWSGWYLVGIPAAFVIGAIGCIAWMARGVFRLVRKRRRQAAQST